MSKQSTTIIARALLAELRLGKDMQQVTKSLAAYLTVERRTRDAQAIIRELERLLLQEEGKLYVHAASAHKLAESQKKQIVEIFKEVTTATEIIVQESIDTDVIGGVRLQTADHQLDLTVQRQLQRLKHASMDGALVS